MFWESSPDSGIADPPDPALPAPSAPLVSDPPSPAASVDEDESFARLRQRLEPLPLRGSESVPLSLLLDWHTEIYAATAERSRAFAAVRSSKVALEMAAAERTSAEVRLRTATSAESYARQRLRSDRAYAVAVRDRRSLSIARYRSFRRELLGSFSDSLSGEAADDAIVELAIETEGSCVSGMEVTSP